MIGRDGWTGLVVLALCAALWWMTLGLHANPLVPIGPGFYPRIVIGLTAFFAALLVLTDVLPRRRARAAAPSGPKANYPLVLASFGAFGAYAVALPWLGFRLATLLYVAGAAALFARPRGAAAWLRIGVLALLTAAIVFVVFEHYLLVLLPRGRWTGF